MKQGGEGCIVNTSYIGGKLTMPHMLPYNASKNVAAECTSDFASRLLPDPGGVGTERRKSQESYPELTQLF